MKRNIYGILSRAICALAIFALSGCAADGLEMPGCDSENQAQLNISLAVPAAEEQSSDTRAEMHATASEGKINDLRLLMFGYEGGLTVVNRSLTIPSEMTLADGANAEYHIDGLTPGAYSVYLLANYGETLAGITDENTLREVMTDYSNRLPEAGNLPMVYECGSRVQINAAGGAGVYLEAQMRIAAVKVRYNLIFDHALNADAFGNAGLRIDRITLDGIAAKSYVIQNEARTDLPVRSVTTTGTYYNAYNENQQNAGVNNADVITTEGNGVATPASYSGKWVYQGTAYLPERYVAADGAAPAMRIDAVMTDASGADGNVKTSYSLPISAYDGAKDAKSMPRGTYYEIVAKIKSLGSANLDANISVKDWMQDLIKVNFRHSSLRVERTQIDVSTLDNDRKIAYESDSNALPTVECATKLQGKPVIKTTVSGADHTITFSINSEVKVAQLTAGEGKGTADCYVTSGNIRKLIRVNYDIEPMFTITPLNTKVVWTATNSQIREKEYYYKTNLNGIVITESGKKTSILINSGKQSGEVTLGSSKLRWTCTNPSAGEGTLVVATISDPVTTTVHRFDAYPADAYTNTKYESLKQALTVTVLPQGSEYRINFRAINDWQKYEGGYSNVSGEWLEGANSMDDSKYPLEYYGTGLSNNNWIDYWYCKQSNGDSAWENAASNSLAPHAQSHRIYIWTQIGETTGVDQNHKVWRFTDSYINSESMTADATNAGWYLYKLKNDKQKALENGASGDRLPEPGTTLMIFNNHTNAKDPGYSVHRATHHLDAGIPLFDYEDKEGWVLYDPTTSPYYRIFDECPVIEDVVYTIYSDVKPSGWFNYYGVAQKETNQGADVAQFEIYSKNVSSAVQETINGKTYWRYKIRMKAPRGYYAKAIKINFDGFATSGNVGPTPTPTTKQYVYYYSKSGWENPKVYIYNDGGGEMTSWGNAPSMTAWKTEGGGTYYYYEVPSAYSNGRVIFKSNDGSNQYPTSNQPGLELSGRTKILYADTKAWQDYTPHIQQKPARRSAPTRAAAGRHTGYMLFGGRTFKDNTGYFNNTTKTWTAGKPQ